MTSPQLPTPFKIAVIVSILAGIVWLLRWLALPKPLRGIPYDQTSATRLAGDVPNMRNAKRVRVWLRHQFEKHNSPIVQVFMTPFQKPWVLVADFREAQDVMIRRTKEFDRSALTTDSFGGVMPESHINMKTADRRFKRNKELVKDLMTPAFLNEVSAPELYEKLSLLLDLWTIKARASNGRPFKADVDIYMVALDITMAVTFDFPLCSTMIMKQIDHINGQRQPADMEASEEPYPFSSVPLDPELQACIYLTESIGVAFQSPFPKLTHWFYLRTARSRKALKLKKALIKRNIEKSLTRIAEQEISGKLNCAVDQILLREMTAAKKRNVQPNFHQNAIYDELFGFIVGGHDTTSSTLAWWVKFMAHYQDSQRRLRNALHFAHSTAFSERRLPTVSEIVHIQVQYLDAMIEETLRFSHIVPIVTREAIKNTYILGHPIPKGTHIFFLSSGASFLEPAFEIEERRRTGGAQNAKNRYGAWGPTDIGQFKPERWLKEENNQHSNDASKREVFDSQAGPQLPFGAGPRACFGRKLAYVEMRIALTLLTWTFEFKNMSEDLNSMEAIDSSTEIPKDCYVRLEKIEY